VFGDDAPVNTPLPHELCDELNSIGFPDGDTIRVYELGKRDVEDLFAGAGDLMWTVLTEENGVVEA